MIQKFVVEVDYEPYAGREEDPVDSFVIEDGVEEILRSLRIDGEIRSFNAVNVTKVNGN